jgi:hypothetical protein
MVMIMYPHVDARQELGEDVPVATKNYWRRRFLWYSCRIKGKQAISSFQNFSFYFWTRVGFYVNYFYQTYSVATFDVGLCNARN